MYILFSQFFLSIIFILLIPFLINYFHHIRIILSIVLVISQSPYNQIIQIVFIGTEIIIHLPNFMFGFCICISHNKTNCLQTVESIKPIQPILSGIPLSLQFFNQTPITFRFIKPIFFILFDNFIGLLFCCTNSYCFCYIKSNSSSYSWTTL